MRISREKLSTSSVAAFYLFFSGSPSNWGSSKKNRQDAPSRNEVLNEYSVCRSSGVGRNPRNRIHRCLGHAIPGGETRAREEGEKNSLRPGSVTSSWPRSRSHHPRDLGGYRRTIHREAPCIDTSASNALEEPQKFLQALMDRRPGGPCFFT